MSLVSDSQRWATSPHPTPPLSLCSHPQLLALLGVGLSSARRLLSKPPKLEATKWHSIGHLQLRCRNTGTQDPGPRTGNSETPQAAPGSPTACQPLGTILVFSKLGLRAPRLGTDFFRTCHMLHSTAHGAGAPAGPGRGPSWGGLGLGAWGLQHGQLATRGTGPPPRWAASLIIGPYPRHATTTTTTTTPPTPHTHTHALARGPWPWPAGPPRPRRLAAQRGKGGLCTALIYRNWNWNGHGGRGGDCPSAPSSQPPAFRLLRFSASLASCVLRMQTSAFFVIHEKLLAAESPSELNAAGGSSLGPSCQCLQAIPNSSTHLLIGRSR
jgi:hypothetical protein